MKCVCGKEMVNTIDGCYHCDNCGFAINDLVFRPRVGIGQAIGYDKPFIQQGWQCPKCGAILAPHQDYCPFCSGSKGGSFGITTITNPKDFTIAPCTSVSSDRKVTGTLKAED